MAVRANRLMVAGIRAALVEGQRPDDGGGLAFLEDSGTGSRPSRCAVSSCGRRPKGGCFRPSGRAGCRRERAGGPSVAVRGFRGSSRGRGRATARNGCDIGRRARVIGLVARSILLFLLVLTVPSPEASAAEQREGVRPARAAADGEPALPERPPRLPEGHAAAEVLWQLALDGRPRGVHPIIAEDRVFFSDASRRVRAVDAATGRAIWAVEARVDGIAHRAGTIYLSEWDGFITAVDADSGEVRWRFGTGGEAVGRPLVGDVLVFGLSNYTDPRSGRSSGYLWALADPPGYELWRFVRTGVDFTPDPVAGDGRIFVMTRAFDRSVIYGVDATTGSVGWQSGRLAPGRILAYADGVLVVELPEKGAFAAFLPASSRKPVWIHGTGRSWAGRPAIADGRMYTLRLEKAEREAKNTYLVALDMVTGEEVWRRATGEWKRGASPDVGDGLVCIGRADRYLYGIDAVDGGIRWIYAPPRKVGRVNVGALDCRVEGARVYAWDGLGHLFAIDAGTGKLAWAHEFPREIAELVVRDGVAYVWVDDGRLYALR